MKFFKTITAVFLLAIYLLSATAIRELLKLPLLANHYITYKSINRDADLFSFLVMHYYIEDGTDKDAAEDRQLPFKSSENIIVLSFVSLVPPSDTSCIADIAVGGERIFLSRREQFLPSQFPANIWQPPRCC